ncbi:MAG TPA: peptidylprolyl isomerase [Pirellulales bacterium]|nr:peptidylprolyl isomerase [Pirellulales bacterium]
MTIWRLAAWGILFLATTGLAAQEKKSGDRPDGDAEPPAGAKSDEANSDDADADEAKSDEADSDEAKSGAEAAATPEGAEFDKLLAEWKNLISKLHELSLTYATALPGKDREAIKEEYAGLVSQGETLEPKFIAGAMSAYASNPKKYREVGDFLASLVKTYVESDDYEPALAPAKVLIDQKYNNPRIDYLAGIAAFATNHFDDAEKYLKQAEKKSALESDGERLLKHIDEYREMWRREQEIREAEAKADDLPRVLLKTNKGDIVIELLENEAPNTVANFISLVEKGFYDGVTFHRVLPGFMAQGGDPDGTGSGGPGYTIPCECTQPDHRLHFRGSLSMAKQAAPDTGGSQFFLMFRPSGPGAGFDLDGKHTVFGRVVEGLDVLAKIQRIDPQAPKPGVKADTIVEAKVLRKRPHEYAPKTVAEK